MKSSTPKKPIRVAALYKFFPLADPHAWRADLLAFCKEHGIRGTLILATEGINGTVAGPEEAIAELVEKICTVAGRQGMELKFSDASEMPFYRAKIRVKDEIVTLGAGPVDPLSDAGTYVSAEDWNALICDPETVVVDTRNNYEVEIGTFRGAVSPDTKSFREFPQWVKDNRDRLAGRKVAMFCTGGIRCEKATAYVRSLGIGEVYHLRGGILRYLEDMPAQDSLWDGECFVFDERVSVVEGLETGKAQLCRACRHPLKPEDLQSPHFQPGVSCPYCHDQHSEEDRRRFAQRQRQVEIAERRGLRHIGS